MVTDVLMPPHSDSSWRQALLELVSLISALLIPRAVLHQIATTSVPSWVLKASSSVATLD